MIRTLRMVLTGALTCFFATAGLAEFNATPDFTKGDPEKGKAVYQKSASV